MLREREAGFAADGRLRWVTFQNPIREMLGIEPTADREPPTAQNHSNSEETSNTLLPLGTSLAPFVQLRCAFMRILKKAAAATKSVAEQVLRPRKAAQRTSTAGAANPDSAGSGSPSLNDKSSPVGQRDKSAANPKEPTTNPWVYLSVPVRSGGKRTGDRRAMSDLVKILQRPVGDSMHLTGWVPRGERCLRTSLGGDTFARRSSNGGEHARRDRDAAPSFWSKIRVAHDGGLPFNPQPDELPDWKPLSRVGHALRLATCAQAQYLTLWCCVLKAKLETDNV
ncbi:hypothetical protein M407DRAFT_11279 [Tulasnella calospora MUT 4182]|uniref:Uncharacterized protein n=1 Tax=Tulasnella calospora MUT 4182 TaxID=1051891 RepID=A0A0C3KDZ1_9AGAM|nr:hypothetical protein M407DRAFT_11279 [Tulasnella calospora MUT 4182]